LAWFFTSNATPKQSSVVRKDSKLAQKLQDGMLVANRSIAAKCIQQDDPNKKQEAC
jgi:hypothetical protein